MVSSRLFKLRLLYLTQGKLVKVLISRLKQKILISGEKVERVLENIV